MHVCGHCGQRYERAGYCVADGHAIIDTDDPLVGTELGRYRLVKVIGQGGMGRVYMAVQPVIGSRVAIKILSEACARDGELLDRFFAEARAVNLIRHENIVSVIDMAKLDDGRPYIVMELIEGMTLAKLVRGGKASLGGIVQVFADVLSALDAAHVIGIVHRDLKPDNILITAKGHAKVLDFGIAKLAPGLDHSPRTMTGALLGTPAYMAPEQISGGERVDARSDIYAAGIVLFEAVTGQQPFRGATVFDLMRAHLEDAPASPRGLRPELPVAIEHVILTALAKDPAQRFQTAAAMAEALHHASADLPPDQLVPLSGGRMRPSLVAPSTVKPSSPEGARAVHPTPPAFSLVQPGPATAPARPRRSRAFGVAAVAIGLAAGALTVAVVTREPSPEPVAPVAVVPLDARAVDPPLVVATSNPDAAAAPAAAAAPDGSIEAIAIADAGASLSPRLPRTVTATGSGRRPVAPVAAATGTSGGNSTRDTIDTIEPFDPVESGSAGGTRITKGGYSIKQFAPLGFLPRARTIARQHLADAQLYTMRLYPVASDGHVDLTRAKPDPSRGVARDNLFTFIAPGSTCVQVRVTAKQIESSIVECGQFAAAVRTPRCTLEHVWQQAIAIVAADPAQGATIEYENNQWVFSGANAGMRTIPDDCP